MYSKDSVRNYILKIFSLHYVFLSYNFYFYLTEQFLNAVPSGTSSVVDRESTGQGREACEGIRATWKDANIFLFTGLYLLITKYFLLTGPLSYPETLPERRAQLRESVAAPRSRESLSGRWLVLINSSVFLVYNLVFSAYKKYFLFTEPLLCSHTYYKSWLWCSGNIIYCPY